MGVINIRALFDWKDVQTGLERLKGQSQKVGADLEKSFSLAPLARNLIGAFGGLKLAELLVNPLKESLNYLQKMNTASRELGDSRARGFMARNTPEQNIAGVERERTDRIGRLDRLNRDRAALPDFENSAYATGIAGVSATMGLSGVPGSAAFQKQRYDSITAERNATVLEIGELEDELHNLKRTVRETARGLDDARDGISDQRQVRRGSISQVEALQRASDRADDKFKDILRTRGRGAESSAARNDLLSAQDAVEIASVPFERDRTNGVLPQIASSSLAQLGGGGNVNVFGGRPGEGLSELREHTRLLRSIDGKTGGRSLTLDVSF